LDLPLPVPSPFYLQAFVMPVQLGGGKENNMDHNNVCPQNRE
jgi:hypothetical protein